MILKIRAVFVEILASTLGNLLVLLQPKKANQLSENGVTLVLNNLSLTERLMRRAILKKVENKQDYETLAAMHQNYWTKQGADFFEATNTTFEKNFLPDCSFIFELLKDELSNQSETFNTLVEIGTGNGNVLEYLSSEFPDINHFVGIDLSQVQVNINIEKFSTNKRLEFVASDGFEWVKKHGKENTIFVTSRGVLEYFTEERLQTFLKKINSLGNTIFIAIEPNGTDHNFDINSGSQPYGPERSFSHNYPKLFKNAGFSIWHLSYKPLHESSKLSFIGVKN
ncbi:class I SAM-dependent methyltransferase [Aquimarina sp. RZ0]|uniref:class I SAM-dependent methyltransferase n=1 Tax=Aquimarina sp. RZ0 TaxID=2607730 RepID=UPI00165F50E8|nr:class I SAM-dependent methyltransferase [Aquimarina sp. RZ0]